MSVRSKSIRGVSRLALCDAAVRALRGPVIYRKLSFETQSDAGNRFVERIVSIVETCRVQKRNTFEYIVQAFTVQFQGKPAPKQQAQRESHGPND